MTPDQKQDEAENARKFAATVRRMNAHAGIYESDEDEDECPSVAEYRAYLRINEWKDSK